MKNAVIIVAGGSGTRMGSSTPKQFLELKGTPILMHTIQRFSDFDPEMRIIVALPSGEQARWKQLCEEKNFKTQHTITKGGSTRTESVQNGLALIDYDCIVGIHDGVRPFITNELLSRCYRDAQLYATAIPAISISETIREIENDSSKTVNRNNYRLIQTPQCFASGLIKKAYQHADKKEFTDDASVVESIGESVHLCEGDKMNIKITVPADLIIGEGILKIQQAK